MLSFRDAAFVSVRKVISKHETVFADGFWLPGATPCGHVQCGESFEGDGVKSVSEAAVQALPVKFLGHFPQPAEPFKQRVTRDQLTVLIGPGPHCGVPAGEPRRISRQIKRTLDS